MGSEEDTVSGISRRAWRSVIFDMIRMVETLRAIGTVVFRCSMKVIGPFFVLLALTLIGFVTYTYFACVVPAMASPVPFRVLTTCFGLFLLLNTLYNYALAILKNPGTPPAYPEEGSPELLECGPHPPKQCHRCKLVKPPRAHHCSICNRCVLKMDHHCPWINNCVGFENYRHFCLFMWFLGAACVFVIVVFWPFYMDGFLLAKVHRYDALHAALRNVAISFMVSVSIFIAMCILGGFHAFLVLTNQTTIEFQINLVKRKEARRDGNYYRNPFDSGRNRNFQQVFGPNPLCGIRWMLPCISKPPCGDGMSFPTL